MPNPEDYSDLLEKAKQAPAGFKIVDDNRSPGKCSQCSNFHNWSKLGPGLWRCGGCGATYERT